MIMTSEQLFWRSEAIEPASKDVITRLIWTMPS
jgi:hypothetical protein